MTTLPERVTITEVGPRDGLQNEERHLDLAHKVELIARLGEAGFSRIEAGSFVSPKAIPQMQETADVFSRGTPSVSVEQSVLDNSAQLKTRSE